MEQSCSSPVITSSEWNCNWPEKTTEPSPNETLVILKNTQGGFISQPQNAACSWYWMLISFWICALALEAKVNSDITQHSPTVYQTHTHAHIHALKHTYWAEVVRIHKNRLGLFKASLYRTIFFFTANKIVNYCPVHKFNLVSSHQEELKKMMESYWPFSLSDVRGLE